MSVLRFELTWLSSKLFCLCVSFEQLKHPIRSIFTRLTMLFVIYRLCIRVLNTVKPV